MQNTFDALLQREQTQVDIDRLSHMGAQLKTQRKVFVLTLSGMARIHTRLFHL